MFSYRAIAGVGAAALAFLALSRVSKRYRHRAGDVAEDLTKKAAGRLEGIIRRRNVPHKPTNDVI